MGLPGFSMVRIIYLWSIFFFVIFNLCSIFQNMPDMPRKRSTVCILFIVLCTSHVSYECL
jgi:hypothetical protein